MRQSLSGEAAPSLGLQAKGESGLWSTSPILAAPWAVGVGCPPPRVGPGHWLDTGSCRGEGPGLGRAVRGRGTAEAEISGQENPRDCSGS